MFFKGFYSELNGKYYSHSATTRLLTRVGINRRRATSEERVLYSIEVLNESQSRGKKEKPVVYTGAIVVANKIADCLQNFIHNHQDDLRLGGATSRGLGRVKITAKSPVDAKALKPSVEERIISFRKNYISGGRNGREFIITLWKISYKIARISPSIYNLMLF
jgi:CRISPR-associated protein Csx10